MKIINKITSKISWGARTPMPPFKGATRKIINNVNCGECGEQETSTHLFDRTSTR